MMKMLNEKMTYCVIGMIIAVFLLFCLGIFSFVDITWTGKVSRETLYVLLGGGCMFIVIVWLIWTMVKTSGRKTRLSLLSTSTISDKPLDSGLAGRFNSGVLIAVAVGGVILYCLFTTAKKLGIL